MYLIVCWLESGELVSDGATESLRFRLVEDKRLKRRCFLVPVVDRDTPAVKFLAFRINWEQWLEDRERA